MRILNCMPPIPSQPHRSGERIAHDAWQDNKKFDTITLAHANLSPEQTFTMETIGRVTQEVRASVTTGDIQSLQNQVAAGQYQINVDAIVRQILLE